MDSAAEAGSSMPARLEIGELLAPDRIIGQVAPGRSIQWLHNDHLGSTRVITDETGAVVSQHKHLPFGEEFTDAGADEVNSHKFTGHERDRRTGLDYMFARYYSPESTFRFLSVDPSRSSPNLRKPVTWNRYSYARNDPMNRFDPDGLKDEYAKYRSTKQAIVDVYNRWHAQSGQRQETGTAAYETRGGESKLLRGRPGSSPDSVHTAGPSSPEGGAEVESGSAFRGEAHIHPSSPVPSLEDGIVWVQNNRAIGIEPSEDPEGAVDAYIVLPDGTVLQIAYGVNGVQVTTVQQLEEELKEEETEEEPKEPDQEEGEDDQDSGEAPEQKKVP